MSKTADFAFPISCGLIGLGRVGIKHLRAIKSLKTFRLVLVITRRPERAKAIVTRVLGSVAAEKVEFLTSIEAIKTWPRIFAIATPSGEHYFAAKAALINHCHLILEKPMALKLAECRELCELAKQNQCHIVMCHIYRYFPLMADLQQNIVAEKYGRLLHINCQLAWGHDAAYYRQAWRGTWQNDGGALMNQGIHACDLAVWLSGSRPVSVQAYTSKFVHTDLEAEDTACMQGHCLNGTTFQIWSSTATNPKAPTAQINLYFTHGEISVSLKNGRPWLKITGTANGAPKRRNYVGALIKKVLSPSKCKFKERLGIVLHPHQGIYADMADLCREDNGAAAYSLRRGALAGDKDGYNAVELVIAAYLSSRNHNLPVALPLDPAAAEPYNNEPTVYNK